MKISDLLIIYFSIGAPFAVRVYFQTSGALRLTREKKLRLDALLTFLFWLPAAVRFFRENKFPRKFSKLKSVEKGFSISARAEKLNSTQKHLEKFLRANSAVVSVFEMRETLRRYVGLTIAAQSIRDDNDEQKTINAEFFRASGRAAPQIAAKCFYRRNRRRLLFHQRRAQTDFLKICKILLTAADDSDAKEFIASALEFIEILNDETARGALEKMFAEQNAPEKRFLKKPLEKDLWKPPTHKPSTVVNSVLTVSPRLPSRAAAMTTDLRKKD